MTASEAPEFSLEELIPWADGWAASVHRKLKPGWDIKDLEQVARVATWKALQAYDPERGVEFGAFAWARVKGAVLMYVRKHYRHHNVDQIFTDKFLADEHGIDESERRTRQIRQRLSLMPQELQEITLRNLIQGLPVIDCAAVMGIAPGHATRLRTRAIHWIRLDPILRQLATQQ